jgi:hypothetical protein
MRFKLAFLTALSVIAISTTSFAQERSSKRPISIRGRVVASEVSYVRACYHLCGLSLIVKLDKPELGRYVVLNVEYMDDRSSPDYGAPTQLLKTSARWKFKAGHETSETVELREFMRSFGADGREITSEAAIPLWKLLNGAETEKLPFGTSLKVYRVKVGRFRPIK